MLVIKRDGRKVEFDKQKIINAILKAMRMGSGIIKETAANDIADEIENEFKDKDEVDISEIESKVYEKLISKRQKMTAKSYEGYRVIRKYQRENGTIDNKVLGIVKGVGSDLRDNSNKATALISTMRDLVAEEVSKDISLRMLLPPHIAQAHNDGLIYIHDLGHYLNPSFNCFSYDTRFVTSDGVKSFGECFDGEKIEVVDQYGEWQKATVRKYSKKPLQKITLKSCNSSYDVRCTYDHRWILKDGSITTDLKVGDKLWLLPKINNKPSYTNKEMFALGFILGDGQDVVKDNSHAMTVRLCGDKNQYRKIFEDCGYKVVHIHSNGDIQLYRAKNALKNNFIENKVWEYLGKEDIIDIFNGYYCADGSKDRNMISTANYKLLEFIKFASGMAGYYISSINVNNNPTNYSDSRTLYEIRFRKETKSNFAWTVTNIDRSDYVPRETWCVEQPMTKTFTLASGVVTGNCELVNLKDMLENGTVINGKLVEKPHSFRTACTIATQIIAQVASGQFGGQTISLAHLAPFVRVSEYKIRENVVKEMLSNHIDCTVEQIENIVESRLKEEINSGIQTFQYQINTLQTSNGQAPFLSVFMYISEYPEYEKETAMLIEEMLKQRIQGMKNEVGVWVTPAFPKLLYVTDENNIKEDSKYYYITEIAAKCVAKRMMPDFLSAKILKQNYEGNVVPPMGKRTLSPSKISLTFLLKGCVA